MMQQNPQPLALSNLDMIKAQLLSEDSDDRRWAVYELQGFELTDTLDYLIQALGDKSRAVREAAAEILELSDPLVCSRRLVPLLGSPRIEVRNICAAILVTYGGSAAPYLIESLLDVNDDVRKFSADILGLSKSKSAVSRLCDLALSDPMKTVAVTAVEALGKIGHQDAIPTLYKIIEANAEMKPEAYEAIGLIGSEESVQYLLARLYHEDPISTFAIVDALGNLGHPKAIGYLDDFLQKTSDYLKPKVVMAILKIASKCQISALNSASSDFFKVMFAEIDIPNDDLVELVCSQLNDGVEEQILEKFFANVEVLPASIIVAMIKNGRTNLNFWDDIIRLVDHPDDWVGYTAVAAFAAMPLDLFVDILKRVLLTQNGIRVLSALSVCESLQVVQAKPEIQKLSKTADQDIQLEAKRILHHFDEQNGLG